MDIVTTDYREALLEQIKQIDVDKFSNSLEIESTSTVIEQQKVYFWIRLYLKDECDNILIGDDINIEWTPSGEKLPTKFVCFGKSGLERDHLDQVTNWQPEDDKKVLCLMVDENEINFSESIPFIRTLFKTGRHYEYQLVKRSELIFVNSRNGFILDYYDCDF
jgi:hypothetical protein